MTVLRFPFAVALLFAASVASLAAAQGATAPILNTLDLRQAISSRTPADQARLASRFTALADRAGLTTGVGARKPNHDELAAFGKAVKACDHRALADYFTALAKRYQADGDGHTGMATLYRTTRMPAMSNHCERLSRLAKGAAEEARSAAAMHTSLAARAS